MSKPDTSKGERDGKLHPRKRRRLNPTIAYVEPLKPASRDCLKRLAAYAPRPQPPYPGSCSAAVLVAIFIGRWGDLYVILSRRAASLSTYAGDTALPGGRVDHRDRSLEDTARREAFEEIGLPTNKRTIPLLCTLEPFLARNYLIVTPVVVLVTDPTIKPMLNAPEVDTLFSHPLQSLLGTTAPFPLPSTSPFFPAAVLDDQAPGFRPKALPPVRLDQEQRQQGSSSTLTQSEPSPPSSPGTSGPVSNEPSNGRRETADGLASSPSSGESGPPPARPIPTAYHSWYDAEWGPTKVRLHTYLTGREASGTKPIAGLTASIMLEVATIGYGRQPVDFEVDAFGQANRRERIAYAINRVEKLQEAVRREKTVWDWEREERKERAKRSKRVEEQAGLGTGSEPIVKSRL